MPPPRVVSLAASGSDMVRALGCDSWLMECVNGRDGIDAAALVALRPDVVVAEVGRETGAATAAGLARMLNSFLLTRPRLVALEPHALTDIWRGFREVADALGVPERGVQQVTRLQARMRSVGGRAAPLAPRPRVACLERIEPLAVAGDWTPELIAMAGATDVFGTPGARASRLGWARLREADPDVIWVAPRGLDLAGTRRGLAALASRRGWNGLRAVSAGSVFIADGSTFFNRPGPRVAETLEILAEALHPEAFRFGHQGTAWERWAVGGTPRQPKSEMWPATG